MPPRIELYWWEGCPSWKRALDLLRTEVEAAGLEASAVNVIEVSDDEEAERLGFPGSPTILVDGVDVQPPSGLATGLTCRVYRRRDGRTSPLPDPEDVRDAIHAAREEDR